MFRYTTSLAPAGTFTVALPDGLYSLDALASYLSTQFQNNGHPPNVVSFSGSDATQSAVLTFSTAGDSIDFTVAGSVGPLLGWPAPGVVVVAPVNDYSAFSPQPAAFNRVNSYIIRSDLVTGGIQLNGSSRSIVAAVPINVRPGSQINFAPAEPSFFDASELIGNPRQALSFELLDQSLRPTPTAGEFWSVTLILKYGVLLSSLPVPMRP
jgi:hypothetical protein